MKKSFESTVSTENGPRRERSALRFGRASVLTQGWIGVATLLQVLSLTAGLLSAQGISPVIVEYHQKNGQKASGSFELKNNTLFPFSVVLEPMSFSVDGDGNPKYRRLDPGIRLRCSATSFRIPPKQSYTVYYEATAEELPVWFTIYARMTQGTSAPQGLQIALGLPHTVYLLEKRKFDRSAVAFVRAESAPGKKKVELELKNQGDQFARVEEIELDSSGGKKTYAGFPFFPGQDRKVELDWDKDVEPQQVALKFDKFTVKSAIRAAQ